MRPASEIAADLWPLVLVPEKMPVDEWADQFRVLIGKTSAQPGRWQTDRTPYLRRPMRLFPDPRIRSIVLMCGSQLGKTELIDTLKLWMIDQWPAPTLCMFPGLDAARDHNQDRFMPALEACAPAAAHLLESKQEVKNLKINLDSMTIWFVGANSPAGRRARPVKVLMCDEIGAYEDPQWVEVLERHKSYGDSKVVMTSTPGDEDTGIEPFYKAGSREHYFVPCPHCGSYQRLIWKGLTWDGGAHADPDHAKATARYICQHKDCGNPIYNWHKPVMLNAGVWVPESRTVEDVVANGEGSISAGIEREDVSFQISSLYSPFEGSTFGVMAAKFCKQRGRMSRLFVNGELGEPWSEPGERTELADVRRLCIPATEEAGGYKLGEAPRGVLTITRAIDVQVDKLYVEDIGWGERGREVWLIGRYEIGRTKGLDLIELDNAEADGTLPRLYKKLNGEEIKVFGEIIDSGHFTAEVYEAVRRRREARVPSIASKGVRGSRLAAPWTLGKIDKFPDGTPIPGGMESLIVNTDYWKTLVSGWIRGKHEAAGPDEADDETPAPLGPGFYLPDNADGALDEYLEHLTSEHRVFTRGKKGDKYPAYEWKLRPGRTANHYFDCRVYNHALGDYFGVRALVRNPEPVSKAKPEQREKSGGFRMKVRR